MTNKADPPPEGEVINLRRTRKRKGRADKAAAAEQNRARFGQPKAARRKAESERRRHERLLDGARLRRSDTQDGSDEE